MSRRGFDGGRSEWLLAALPTTCASCAPTASAHSARSSQRAGNSQQEAAPLLNNAAERPARTLCNRLNHAGALFRGRTLQ
jgi:hypothetical protein